MKNFWILRRVKILILVGLGVTLFGYIVMHLWNWLLPEIIGASTITFIQAIGLLILSRLLFGGFHRCGKHHGHHGHWRHRLKEKYSTMTPEEKEKFREKFGKYCQYTHWDCDNNNEKEQEA